MILGIALRGVAVASLITVGAPMVFAADVDDVRPDPAPQQQLRALLRDRVTEAKQALEATEAAYDAGTVAYDQLLDAVNQHAEAESAVATTDAERIAAAERRVHSLREIEQKIGALHEAQARGGEADKFHVIRRERLSAEIDLNKARCAQPQNAELEARKTLERRRALVEGEFALKSLEVAKAALEKAEEARKRSPGVISEAELERLRLEVARSLAIVEACEIRAEEAGLAGLKYPPARRPVEAIRKDLLEAEARRDELKGRQGAATPQLRWVKQEGELELLEAELVVLRLELENALSKAQPSSEERPPQTPEGGGS